jgi:ELWxxDGT repeat protein
MRKFLLILFLTLAPLSPCLAQEVTFDRVELPTRVNESLRSISMSHNAGNRKILIVDYDTNGALTRRTIVGVEGKNSEELIDAYRDHQSPFYTDIKMLPYKNEVVVTVRNGGTDVKNSIWVTDGTRSGTREISGEDPGASPFIINDTLVLILEDCSVRFVDLRTGAATAFAGPSTPLDYGLLGYLSTGRAVFRAGASIYVSDGTAGGTQLILTSTSNDRNSATIFPADENDPSTLRVFDTGQFGLNFITDGTPEGTKSISNTIEIGIQLGNVLIFSKTTAEHGRELWSLNLATLEESLLKDIAPGASSGVVPGGVRRVNDKVFFFANDGNTGRELWVTDGSAAGTILTKDIIAGVGSGVPDETFSGAVYPAIGSHLLFTAGTSPRGLWASDGTADGTFRLSNAFDGIYGFAATINDGGILAFLSLEQFGITLSQGEDRWDSGIFLRFFDPSQGPSTSAFLAVDSQNLQPLTRLGVISMAGDYYYFTSNGAQERTNILYTAPRQLCGTSDFKPTPGQCGCGTEEIAADSSGTIAQSNADADGSVVCLTPIGPIFVPVSLRGAISGRLTQGGGRPNAVELAIPTSMTNALQQVIAAPNVEQLTPSQRAAKIYTTLKASVKPQNVIGVVIVDRSTNTIKKLPIRRTTRKTLTIKLGRRLTKHQLLTFQYATAVENAGARILQTPYRKSGAIKLKRVTVRS